MSRCTVVLGIPRSGTSLAAGLLHHLGIYMGDRFPPITPMNPKGFFEDEEFTAIHNEIMSGQHEWPIALVDEQSDIYNRYHLLVKSREVLKRLWGFKTQYGPNVFPVTQKLLSLPPKIIWTDRPFDECVDSWSERRGITSRQARHEQSRILYAVEKVVKTSQMVYRLAYDDILGYPEKEIECLACFVGMPVTKEALKFPDETLRRFQ